MTKMNDTKYSPKPIEPFHISDEEAKRILENIEKEKKLLKEKSTGTYERIATDIGKLCDEKNKHYGNSFAQSKEFLQLLWPNGVPVESYTDMLGIIRIFDKLKRIATSPEAFGENPCSDVIGYALLMIKAAEDRKKALSSKDEKANDRI